jgi:membrane-associated phospholipid phosphatase
MPVRREAIGDFRESGIAALPAVAVCAAMLLFAAVTAALARISAWPLLSYFQMTQVTLLGMLLLAFWVFAKAALRKTADPIAELRSRMLDRLPLLLLPAVVLPAFLLGYTTAKTAIPLVVGYSWDGFFTHIDRLIFGDDAWRISRAIFGNSSRPFWAFWYAIVWGTAFVLATNAVALLGRRAFVGTFFTALMAAWLIGGTLMAYAFSAAGPVFAPVFEPSLATQFHPLQEIISRATGYRPIGTAQEYLLVAARETHVAQKGGGISAFPSMHLATVTIYVMAARRTFWLIPALVLWVSIFIASAYFGFHYWVDGIVGTLVAVGCWQGAAWLYSKLPQAPERAMTLEPAAA